MWKLFLNLALNFILGELAGFAKQYVEEAEKTDLAGQDKHKKVFDLIKDTANIRKKELSTRAINWAIESAVILNKGK